MNINIVKDFSNWRVIYSFNFNHQLLKILFYFESNLIYIDCILNIFISIYFLKLIIFTISVGDPAPFFTGS